MTRISKISLSLLFSVVLSTNIYADNKKQSATKTVSNNSTTASIFLVDVESRTDLSKISFQNINNELKTTDLTEISSQYGTIVGQRIIVLANSALSDNLEYDDTTKIILPDSQSSVAPNETLKREWLTGIKVNLNIKDTSDKKLYAYVDIVNNSQAIFDSKTNQYSIKSTKIKNTLLLNKNDYQLVSVNSVYNEDATATKQKSKIQFTFIQIK